MFSVLSAVLEPFLLIALGYALRGTKRFGAKELWDGVEKLVFWVLFPPLLFNSVAHAKLTGLDTAEFLLFGTLAMATGVFMAKAVSKMAPADPMTDASVRQTGYRFNSYICFALALNRKRSLWWHFSPASGFRFQTPLPWPISLMLPKRAARQASVASSNRSSRIR